MQIKRDIIEVLKQWKDAAERKPILLSAPSPLAGWMDKLLGIIGA